MHSVMNKVGFVVAICYLSVVQASYQSQHDTQLQSVPDASSYGKTVYPKLSLHDLGENFEEQHTPEVIKITKTIKVEVPHPYPVHVHQKVPYPVQVKVPHIIKVPHLVKIAHPVPVEVVKHVPVPQNSGHGQDGGGDAGAYGGSYGQGFGHIQSQYGSSGYGGQDAYSSQQPANAAYGGDQGSQSYGAPSASYGIPSSYGAQSYGGQSYGGDQSASSFVPSSYQTSSQGGDSQGSDDSNSVNSYQSYHIQNQFNTGSEQQVHGGGDQGDQQGDHTAQASSAEGMMQEQSQMTYTVGAGYQVKDTENGGMNHQQ